MAVKLEKIELVVFDLDDTLYPERQFVDSGFRAVADHLAGRLNLPAAKLLADLVAAFEGGRQGAIFQAVLECNGINVSSDSQLIGELVQVYRQHRPSLTLFDDAQRALQRLRPVHKLAILTDGYLQVQSNKVQALGLEAMVDRVVYTDTWGPDAWKPAPDGFMFLQEKLSVRPGECIYVADNVRKDFVAPNQLGWQTAIVRRAGGVYDYDQRVIPAGGEPRWSISSLDELEL